MKLPPLSARGVTKALSALGFEKKRQRGSHMIFRHPETKATVIVPDHGNKELKKGTLRNIVRQANVSVNEFVNATKK